MNNVGVDPDQEEAQYLAEVAAVKKWWTDSRWRFTKRPFTAEQIVAKRGNLKIVYPSNTQSKKLWNILEDRFQVCFLPELGVLGGEVDFGYRMEMLVIPMGAWNLRC